MAEEKAAESREKKEKRKTDAVPKAATGPSTTASRKKAAPVRMKIVWAVCDPNARVLKTFPYPDKPAAEAEAARLSKEREAIYKVRPEKVPMEE